ncbi:MAG: DUF4097 family beta strand repeat-containing protein [Acidobacteriota bacterium]
MSALDQGNNKTMKGRTLLLALFLAVICGSLAVRSAQNPNPDEIHETYELAAGGSVSVSNLSGYIRVSGWDENRVRVDAIKRGARREEFGEVQIQISSTPGSLVVRAISQRTREARISPQVTVDFDIKVPRSAILSSVTSSSGEVQVRGPVAQVTARSSSGSIDVRDVRGTTSLTTTSGPIIARNTGGPAADTVAISTSGSVDVEQPNGRTTARSLSGAVSVIGAAGDVTADSTGGQVRVERARGRVNASCNSGKVLVRDAAEGVTARGVSGGIEITQAKGRVSAITLSGGIILKEVESVDVVAKTTSGNVTFEGRVGPSGRYALETFSGVVLVTIPDDSQFTLTARTFNGSMNTEFPIQIEPGSIGGDRQIRGTAGKGGGEIIATSFNGRIEIRKARSKVPAGR